MQADTIRVMLADDHAVVRAGLRAVLGAARDVDVVGECDNGADALAMAERLKPDVLVTDYTMPVMNGLELTREVRARALGTKVLVLTMHDEEEYVMPALQAGAAGYLLKNAADRELVDAVRSVASGDGYLATSAARVLARRIARPDPAKAERARYDDLTAREHEVFGWVAEGWNAPDIGARLGISPKTVDTYKQRINEKLGLRNRADYVRLALKLGVLHA
jgi:two-component system, NarL family, response regulator NreC